MFNVNEFNNSFSPELLSYIPLIILILALWSLFWKGKGLWRAARAGHQGWFVVFLLFHTLGLLEIIYIVFVNKNNDNQTT
ncbi:MAG: DUF5652 family protein [Candidatus Altimarinota bacterium]